KVFLTVLGLIYIAESLEVEILPLLTGLGIGGLALGLAAKDSIENFFGSIAVIFDSPFEVGDWVEINGHEGTVEAIGLRSTRIRTFYNSLISVPNATLVRAVVDNYGRRQYRRYTTRLNLTYGTPPDKIEAFCEAVREIVRLHPYTRKDSFHVYMNGFGAHSLDVLVYIFFKCPDWATELRERQRFILDVIRAADAVGVDFAFPTQTIEMKNAGEIRPADPLGIPAQDASQQAVALGREVTRRITSNQAWRDTTPAAIKLEGPPRPDSAGGDG
ncbi:MAG: mechanosensitive ion channel domain-containing protein, partial [Planctomycetota bacterium]